MTVLSVSNVGKVFWDFKKGSHRLLNALGFLGPQNKKKWVFRNVSFELNKGETLGIIGRNGEGKSTLLKIIAGVMKPSEGNVSYKGRVSAILELGMGFNADLTARQNALHVLSMMGNTYEASKELIPEIEEFADIGEFFDKPIRIFSSGMIMRVAFGISISVRPDIMIVDEALSVGDIYFQQKCLDRLKELTSQGMAMLMVSHDPNTLRSFCSRACLLEKGHFYMGETTEILEYYESLSLTEHMQSPANLSGRSTQESETKETLQIDNGTVAKCRLQICNEKNSSATSFDYGEKVVLQVEFLLNKRPKKPVIGLILKDRLGRDIFSADTAQYSFQEVGIIDGRISAIFEFKNILVEGLYFVSLSLADTLMRRNVFADHHYFCHRIGHFYSSQKEGGPSFCGVADLQIKIRN